MESTSDAPRIVWAVTSGEYSDYRVRALFEREGDAHSAMATGLGDDVAEFRLYSAGAKLPEKVGYWRAFVSVDRDGVPDSRGVVAYADEDWSSNPAFRPPRRPRVTVNRVWGHGVTDLMAEALTEDAAKKALHDRVAKMRAEALDREALKPKPGAKPNRGRK